MRRLPILVNVALLAALAAPSQAAAAKDFEGKTRQGRTVELTIGDDQLLDTLRINWFTRRCSKPGSRFQNMTVYRRPYDQSTPDAFTDVGSYVAREGAIRARVRLTLTGERRFDPNDPADESWRGTLRGRIVVRRRGRVIDRCRLRELTWSARLVT